MDGHFLKAKNVARLIGQYLDDEHGKKPEALEAWIAESEDNRRVFDEILSGSRLSSDLEFYDRIDPAKEWSRYTGRGSSTALRYRRALRIAGSIAAVFVLVAGLTLLFPGRQEQYGQVKPVSGENIYPGHRKAVFAAGGTQIDIMSNTVISNTDGTVITDPEGRQVYSSGDAPEDLQRLIVPRGGEFDIVLGDGTKIWLNADSELNYPRKFNDKYREVTVRGEAYLEVAHNPSVPFFVNIGDARVRVLGTSFAVNNYSNEENITVSLLTGKVGLETEAGEELARLSPMERVRMHRQTGTVNVEGFNKQGLLDWKNDLFIFTDEDLGSIARRLERWYDRTIEVDPALAGNRYSGIIDRQGSMQSIIFILTNTNEMEILEDSAGKIFIKPI